MIFKYDDFLLENMINESILYYSPKVRSILSKIDDPIAKDLTALETTDLPIDVTFVDIDENREGYLTFTTMKSAEKYLLPLGQGTVDFFKGTSSSPDYQYKPEEARKSNDAMAVDKHQPYIKSRNPVKLGKFVNNLLPDKYNERERESFVNKFKARLEASAEKFIIVDGEDFNFYYWHENYKEKKGTIGNSCMCDEKDIFDIYVENPDVCRLLVLLEDELVIGRAVIWKLSHISQGLDAEYFLDRQYTIKESDVDKFRDYADKEGWAYKDVNSHSSFRGIVYKGSSYNVDMEVEVTAKRYDSYPYMDTFRSYEYSTGTLINENRTDDRDYYLLDDTSGGYTDGSRVYSEYEQDEIDRDDAVWSEPLDSWISDYDSVEVERASSYRDKGWYPSGHRDITYDGWNEEHIHVDDAKYSEEYQYDIYYDDAISVIYEIDEDGVVNEEEYYMHRDDSDAINITDLDSNWYKKFTEEYDTDTWDNHTRIKKELLSKDYKGEWVPDVFLVGVYKVDKTLNLFNSDKITDDFIEKFKNIDMLSEIDARAFEFNVTNDEEEKKERVRTLELMDKWTYDDYIKPIRELLIQELKSKIEEMVDEDLLNDYEIRLEELEMNNYEEQKAED
jgi:hypothetical protein